MEGALKPTVYIETTIVSYLTARPTRDVVRLAHEVLTQSWWVHRRSDFELFTSDAVVAEASAGDQTAAAVRLAALSGIRQLSVTDSALLLAQQLVVALALPARARLDAVHVAIASVHDVDYLLTWNCRHLANGALAPIIERTCAAAGFVAPRILTPELLMEPL